MHLKHARAPATFDRALSLRRRLEASGVAAGVGSLRHFVDEGYSYIGAPWHPRVCHAHHPLAVTRPFRPKLRRSALRSSSASGRLAQSVISPDDQRPDGAFHDGAFACVGNSGLSLWRRQDVLTLQPAVDECRVAVSPARKRLNRIM